MRTCSVCGVEIDKTTAYTVSGEQKAQGRRCINCVEGASNKATSAPVQEAAAEPQATSKAPENPVAGTTSPSEPPRITPVAPPTEEAGDSTVKYIVGAVIIAVVLYLVLSG